VSWDWLDQVPTAAVGLAGIAATILALRAERKHSDRLAGETRRQERRQATYERLLTQAIEVTEFVAGADVIFVRHSQPPDLDVESYDAWLVLDLYASEDFAAAYRVWQSKIEVARDILDSVPERKRWFEVKGDLPDRFRAATTEAESALRQVIAVARKELG